MVVCEADRKGDGDIRKLTGKNRPMHKHHTVSKTARRLQRPCLPLTGALSYTHRSPCLPLTREVAKIGFPKTDF